MKEYEDKKSKEWIDSVEVQLPGYLKRNLLKQPETTLSLRTPHLSATGGADGTASDKQGDC